MQDREGSMDSPSPIHLNLEGKLGPTSPTSTSSPMSTKLRSFDEARESLIENEEIGPDLGEDDDIEDLDDSPREKPRGPSPVPPLDLSSTRAGSASMTSSSAKPPFSKKKSPKRLRRSRRRSQQQPQQQDWTLLTFYRNPEIKKKKLTIAAGLVLFLVGVIFLLWGIIQLHDSPTDWKGYFLLIVGCISALPGGYACAIFYKALRHRTSHHLNQLPSYDD